MGWEGTTGHLYLSGSHAHSNGTCKRYTSTQGRKIKAVYGNYTSLLALCDGWEFEWMSPEMPGLAKSLNDVKIHQLAFGKAHTAALSLDGHIFVWGDARFGQLGLGGSVTTKEHPVKIGQLDHVAFSSIACGGYHTAALSDAGDLYTWGRNFEGQLGHSTVVAPCDVNEKLNGVFHRPKHVAAFLKNKCKEVACGDKFTVVLTADGEIYAFGEGQAGQLGIGRCTKGFQPKLALTSDAPDDPFVEIACGWAHALAMTRAGRLFAWGFNQYGQLGAGDTKTRFVPVQIPCVPVAHVFAGGNYSAAITSGGRLLTWGNACHGKLAHVAAPTAPVLTPTLVDELKDTYVQSVACSSDNLLVFAPTWVSGLYPPCGALSGGSKLTVFGSGFWDSDDLTVRFVPLTEGRLPRAALAAFDADTGEVSCVLPKFSVAGEFAVEVAMNGKHFTTNGHAFEVYVAPTITHISHDEIPFGQAALVQLRLTGDKPKASDRPSIKWVPLHPSLAPVVVVGEYGRVEATAKDNQDDAPNDDEPGVPKFTITFATPAFDPIPTHLVPCNLQVSLNGQDFDLVQLQGAPTPQVVYFHNAEITRCTPNSMPFTDTKATVAIHVNQLFDVGRLVCKASYSERKEPNCSYRVATAALPIVSVKLDDQIVVCSVPAFSDWTVQTIAPEVDQSDNSDDESGKTSAPPPSTSWFHMEMESFQAHVLVSVNGGATFLPPATLLANVLNGYAHGALSDVSPSSGPITGGTIVSLGAMHLAFDTDDSLVSVEYDGDLQTVNAFVRKGPEADRRVATFQMPSFVPADHSDDSAASPVQPATAFSPATVRLALSGTSYGDSTVAFEFYRNPVIRSIEPQLASVGSVLTLTGSFLKITPTMKCKVHKSDGSFASEVEAEYKEEKAGPCYKVELPQLGAVADGELVFSIALNGQQYATTEFAKFTYVDQPEVPLGKEDKRKH